jgi:hypothetical protein
MLVTRWLLSRVRLDNALAGDLEEQVSRGKSTLWLLRQVLLALLVRAGRLFLDRPLTTMRFMILGWGSALLLQFLAIVIARSAEPALYRWAFLPDYLGVRIWWSAHTYLVVSGVFGLALAGWLVARTATLEDQAPLVLVLFASVLVWQLTGRFYWTALPSFLPLHQGAWVALDGWTTVASLLLMPLSVVWGALLMRDRRSPVLETLQPAEFHVADVD